MSLARQRAAFLRRRERRAGATAVLTQAYDNFDPTDLSNDASPTTCTVKIIGPAKQVAFFDGAEQVERGNMRALLRTQPALTFTPAIGDQLKYGSSTYRLTKGTGPLDVGGTTVGYRLVLELVGVSS